MKKLILLFILIPLLFTCVILKVEDSYYKKQAQIARIKAIHYWTNAYNEETQKVYQQVKKDLKMIEFLNNNIPNEYIEYTVHLKYELNIPWKIIYQLPLYESGWNSTPLIRDIYAVH